MAKTLDYPDAYLAKFCTDEREERAFDEVDQIATAKGVTFSATWRSRLALLRCYCIACLENQAAADDLFTAKLKSYRAEFDSAMALAVADANETAEVTDATLIFNVPVYRA